MNISGKELVKNNSAPFVLHYGSGYSGPNQAIGGYMRSLEKSCHLANLNSRILDSTFSKDPRKFILDQIDNFASTYVKPIFHLQLTLPYDECPLNPSDLRERDYGLVITCQEFERRTDPAIRDDIINFCEMADQLIFLGQKDYEAMMQHTSGLQRETLDARSGVIPIVPPSIIPYSKVDFSSKNDIAFLNLIWPGRVEALEECALELCRSDWLSEDRKLHVIGRSAHESLTSRIRSSLGPLSPKVQLHLDVPDYVTSNLLGKSRLGISCPKGGITDYGTVIPTLLAHGIVPIVNPGYKTDMGTIDFCKDNGNPEASLISTREVDYSNDLWPRLAGGLLAEAVMWAYDEDLQKYRTNSKAYLDERSFQRLADSHLEVYKKIL